VSKLRIVLVGDARDRERLRASVAVGFDIVGEASTIEAAQALGVGSDLLFVRSNEQKADLTPAPEPLTPRELEVLNLLAEGLPNKAIAARLEISDQTVKFHVASICGKLGVGNRTSAVRAAVRRGWLTF